MSVTMVLAVPLGPSPEAMNRGVMTGRGWLPETAVCVSAGFGEYTVDW